MDASLSTLLNLYVFTPGRRIYVLRQLRELVDALGAEAPPALGPAIDQALAHEDEAAALSSAYHVARRMRMRGVRPMDIDPQIDRKLMLVDRILGHHAAEQGEDGRYAARLRATLFPAGVLRHIQMTHVDQLAGNDHVLSMLDAPERQPWVDRLGLRALVTSMHELNESFRQALIQRYTPARVRRADVRAAHAQGQELLLEIVARIVGAYPTRADAPMRAHLLRPVLAQNEAIRLLRKRRRRAVDIDLDGPDSLPDELDDAPAREADQGTDQDAGQAAGLDAGRDAE